MIPFPALTKMFEAGLDAVRCNFSHGCAQDHKDRVEMIRSVAKKTGHKVGVLGDLQGPKIRIARFKDDKVMLEEGQEFILDGDMDLEPGDSTCVGIDYPTLPQEVASGDILLLDDGKIVFKVKEVSGKKVVAGKRINAKVAADHSKQKNGLIHVDFDDDFWSFWARSWALLRVLLGSLWHIFPPKLVPEPSSNRLIFEKVILCEIVCFQTLLGSSGSHMVPPNRPRSLQDGSKIVLDRFFVLNFRFFFNLFYLFGVGFGTLLWCQMGPSGHARFRKSGH